MLQLPIDPFLQLIFEKSASDKPLILTASPGSGKTTRVPSFLMHKLLEQKKPNKKIIVIVPKRVSAVAAADRIASENNWNLGEIVGYQVRFDNMTSRQTQLVFMTEGLFLKQIQQPNFWTQVHTLILDEFHERSAQIDLILGLAFEQKMLGTDLKLIVMSATLNTSELQRYFVDCETVEVKAPPHKLELHYNEKSQKLICDDQFLQHLKNTLSLAWKTAQKDILIFLPGLKEILRFKNIIQPLYPQNKIEVLHSSVHLNEQKRIIQKTDLNRRIILSTNVAESSLTVSGIDCVIDSGLEKKSYIEPKVGFTGLDIQRISLFSATQRAGRAAREQSGYCFKLWHPTDELSMKEQIEPEILKSDLIYETLLLKQQDVADVKSFTWLSQPNLKQIQMAETKLKKWLLLESNSKLTELSKIILQWPISLENAVVHYHLSEMGFNDLSAKIIAVLESGKVEDLIEKNKHFHGTDLEKILDNYNQDPTVERIYKQILHSCKTKIQTQTSLSIADFSDALIKTYAKYFPEKIGYLKGSNSAVSIFGRGLQLANAKADYFIALAGKENHSQFTQVTFSVGFDKKMAQNIFSELATKKADIYYDFEKNEFYKNEKLSFESLILNDYGKTKLSQEELRLNWKTLLKESPVEFFKIHPEYDKIKNKINFILNRNDIFQLTPTLINELKQKDDLLLSYILNIYDDYTDFKNCDLIYLSYQVFSDSLCDILQNLPETIKSPRGRVVTINYTDDKAPLISLKIQDAFGWSDTPKIYHNKINLTLELLAPNMRPAQITNQLQNFWKSSYADVRKDLRARYPKHDWPEDPS